MITYKFYSQLKLVKLGILFSFTFIQTDHWIICSPIKHIPKSKMLRPSHL